MTHRDYETGAGSFVVAEIPVSFVTGFPYGLEFVQGVPKRLQGGFESLPKKIGLPRNGLSSVSGRPLFDPAKLVYRLVWI